MGLTKQSVEQNREARNRFTHLEKADWWCTTVQRGRGLSFQKCKSTDKSYRSFLLLFWIFQLLIMYTYWVFLLGAYSHVSWCLRRLEPVTYPGSLFPGSLTYSTWVVETELRSFAGSVFPFNHRVTSLAPIYKY